ncbi:hypothetical protein V2G26_010550 [Clonostachys chloroleuca]
MPAFENGTGVADGAPNGSGPPPHSSYPRTHFQLEDHPVDERRRLPVGVIGAGIAGITAGILLPAKVPEIDLTIYEQKKDVGGVWYDNVYPGVRCDVPAHVYQSSIEPNSQWSEVYAQGAEILAYWKNVARKRDVYKYCKFETEVIEARWSDDDAVWRVKVRHAATGERTDEFDVLLTAHGRFTAWRLPDYPGLDTFKGFVRHTSNWDPSFDFKGKRVAVIGNGASGLQVVPNLQPHVARLDHYARNKTWIAGAYTGDNERKLEAQPIPLDLRDSFKDDADKYLAYRKGEEDQYWRRFDALFRNSDTNSKAKQQYLEVMRKRVEKKLELLDSVIPDFAPHCRRLTPAPGYLEALCEENVDFIQTPIKSFTETGIETVDGKQRDVDAIFCATGANVESATPFSVIARGVDLREAWKPDGLFGWPYSYMGVGTPGFPNLFFIFGPHSAGVSGTVPSTAENYVTYIAKVLRKISSQGIRTITPSRQAANDFVEYSDAFFPKTYLTDHCSAWHNSGRPGSRIHAHWPGSASHERYVRFDPRWEDFEYTYLSRSGNRFAWLGNGWSKKEKNKDEDLTWYLRKPEEVNLKSWYENWYEVW